MTITWVVVANARNASFYENQGPNKGLTLVKQIDAKNGALPDDLSHGAMDRSDWHGPDELRRHHARGFAHRVMGELRAARQGNSFARAVLVAPPTFMGLLNAELDDPTAQKISGRLEKDYTRSPAAELCERLGDCLCA